MVLEDLWERNTHEDLQLGSLIPDGVWSWLKKRVHIINLELGTYKPELYKNCRDCIRCFVIMSVCLIAIFEKYICKSIGANIQASLEIHDVTISRFFQC